MYAFTRTDGSIYEPAASLVPSQSFMAPDPVATSLRSDPLNTGTSFIDPTEKTPTDPTMGARVGNWFAENTTLGGLSRSATAENATPGQQGLAGVGLGMMGLGMLAGGPLSWALTAGAMGINYAMNNMGRFGSDPMGPSDVWNDPDKKWDPETPMPSVPTVPVEQETTYGGGWGGGDGNSGNWSAGGTSDNGEGGWGSWA